MNLLACEPTGESLRRPAVAIAVAVGHDASDANQP
jgi:hypothetical protein